MEIVNIKPNFNVGVWAENGNIVIPTSEKIEIGHIVEKPKSEIVNWIENRQDVMLLYINQRGIPEWDVNTTYPFNGLTSRDGTLYRAKSQNKGRDPTLNLDIWKLAVATYDDYVLLVNEINNIKNTDGYLDLYVSKNTPIMTGGAEGVSYGFTDDVDTGLVKDIGGNPAIQKDGVVVASFNNLDQNETVVTLEMLKRYIELYKVGDLYLTTSQTNPRDRFGYGTWEKYGKGKALVGHTDDVTTASPDWTKVVNATFGTYSETLTIAQLPNFRVETPMTRAGRQSSSADWTWLADADGHANDGVTDSAGLMKSRPVGDSQSHNNVQPSVTIFVWRRTA